SGDLAVLGPFEDEVAQRGDPLSQSTILLPARLANEAQEPRQVMLGPQPAVVIQILKDTVPSPRERKYVVTGQPCERAPGKPHGADGESTLMLFQEQGNRVEPLRQFPWHGVARCGPAQVGGQGANVRKLRIRQVQQPVEILARKL